MKTKIALTILTITSTLGFAIEPITEMIPNPVTLNIAPKTQIQETIPKPRSFTYLRMGVSEGNVSNIDLDVVPGLGIGYRLTSGASAIDLSASFNRREVRSDEGKEKTYFYTLPKVNYLHYISPASGTSVYAGGGLAWGGIKNQEDQEFLGLIPNVAIGIEMNRNAAWRSFIQLDVSQPAIPAQKIGDIPKPFAELTLGAGF